MWRYTVGISCSTNAAVLRSHQSGLYREVWLWNWRYSAAIYEQKKRGCFDCSAVSCALKLIPSVNCEHADVIFLVKCTWSWQPWVIRWPLALHIMYACSSRKWAFTKLFCISYFPHLGMELCVLMQNSLLLIHEIWGQHMKFQFRKKIVETELCEIWNHVGYCP